MQSRKTNIAALMVIMASASTAMADTGMLALSDQELGNQTGQALVNLSYLASGEGTNTNTGVGLYKLGMEAELELNSNIKNLQLGCGGVNGTGNCDVDIKNLAISGLPDSYDSTGNPVFNNGRASTSAKLTNPFIEFAIKNPTIASTRELVGFRLSAEKIVGLLTAGTANTQTPTDGIQRFSGYMKIASTTGSANTQATKFGLTEDQTITGRVRGSVLGIPYDRQIKSYSQAASIAKEPNDTTKQTSGITVPTVGANFTVPAFTVNGSRLQNAQINNIKSTISNIPLSAAVGAADYGAYANDQLRVNLRNDNDINTEQCVSFVVCNATFKMDKGSAITNMNLNISLTQALSMIHNIPLNGTGAYISLQNQAVKWSNTNSDDIAQRGWWLSFSDPVNLGVLNVSQQVDINSVMPQVALAVSDVLDKNRIILPSGSSTAAVFGNPIYAKLIIDLNAYTTTNPVALNLTNQILQNQQVSTNCYGGLTFC